MDARFRGHDDKRASASTQAHARLVFRDDGPGFAPELRERIFEPFFTTKRDAEGTGLGLALVKDIVAWHGGRVEAESRPGEGAAFTLYLPLARPRHRA